MDPQTLGDSIRWTASRRPDAPVLLGRDRAPLSYGGLADQLDRSMASLAEAGFGANDCVAMMCSTTLQAIGAYLCLRNVVAVAALDSRLSERELRDALSRVQFKALAASTDLIDQMAIAQDMGLAIIKIESDPAGPAGLVRFVARKSSAPCRPKAARSDDMATIQMTSGTTGHPKAALALQGPMLRRALNYARYSELGPEDVGTTFSPPYVSALFNRLESAISVGGAFLVNETFDADGFFRDIVEYGVTWYAAGPVFHRQLLARARYHKAELARSKLRLIRSSTTKLPPQMMAELEETFGAVCIEQLATTETGLIATNPLPPGYRKPGTVGRAAGYDIAILDDEGNPLPENETGNLAVRSDMIFCGYMGDPEQTEASFKGDWFCTGDMASIDEDGYITLSGRTKELINRGGEKVSPIEVEAVLSKFHAVLDCICFPMPHRTLGQIPAAAVTLRPGQVTSEAELRQFALERLSKYKVPTPLFIVDEIPSTASGKINRLKAFEALGKRRERDPQMVADRSAETAPYDLSTCLLGIWKSVLGVSQLRGDDNFFVSGGDSLLAMRLVLTVEEVTGVSLPIEVLYGDGASVDGMAEIILSERERARTEADDQKRQIQELKTNAASLRTRARSFLGRSYRRLSGKQTQDELIASLSLQTDLKQRPSKEEIFRRLNLLSQGWHGHRFDAPLPVFGFNLDGTKPPLLWCFNEAEEANSLGIALGADQPLIALRSLSHVLADRTLRRHYIEALVATYIDFIEGTRIWPPLAIGGNCGAGPIAEEFAHQMIAKGLAAPLLLLLEYEPSLPYPGRVVMLFGRESRWFNPFYSRVDPVAQWRDVHAEPVWNIVSGDHGQFFNDRNIESLVEAIASQIKHSR